MTVEATLCQIIDDDRILLQKKSTGKFGEGKWNGPGGKLKLGESPYSGVIREVYEETGLLVSNLKYHGCLKHFFGNIKEVDWMVHIFSSKNYKGKLKESDEGELKWFSFREIPFREMWQDDKYWLPLLLEGKNFEGEFYFNEDGTKLIDHNLVEKK